MLVLQAAAILALMMLTVFVVGAMRVFSRQKIAPVLDEEWSKLRAGMLEIGEAIDVQRQKTADLTIALDEGIKGYKRAENRIQKTVVSARRLIRENGLEHAGIEAEYEELRERDGEASPEPELPPLLAPVEEHQETGIPGVSQAELEAIRERSYVS